MLESVVEAVGGRRLLVLLDNCEHVVGACAEVADALLRRWPNVALLATSREPLGIDGEHVYRVPSLRTPAEGDDAPAIRASEALRLMAAAGAARAGTATTTWHWPRRLPRTWWRMIRPPGWTG